MQPMQLNERWAGIFQGRTPLIVSGTNKDSRHSEWCAHDHRIATIDRLTMQSLFYLTSGLDSSHYHATAGTTNRPFSRALSYSPRIQPRPGSMVGYETAPLTFTVFQHTRPAPTREENANHGWYGGSIVSENPPMPPIGYAKLFELGGWDEDEPPEGIVNEDGYIHFFDSEYQFAPTRDDNTLDTELYPPENWPKYHPGVFRKYILVLALTFQELKVFL